MIKIIVSHILTPFHKIDNLADYNSMCTSCRYVLLSRDGNGPDGASIKKWSPDGPLASLEGLLLLQRGTFASPEGSFASAIRLLYRLPVL